MSYPGYPPSGYPPPGYPVPGPPPVQGLGDLSLPIYNATFGQAVGRFWRKYVDFSGRASRSEYWWWYLVAVMASTVLTAVNYSIVGIDAVPYLPGQDPRSYFLETLRSSLLRTVGSFAWTLVTLVGQIALTVRRLHDTNRSGWWYLISLVPLVGTIILIVFMIEAPRPEGQHYDRRG